VNMANEVMKNPVMSVMIDIKTFLICGSTNGLEDWEGGR
jgi:hypothetical protein